MRGFLERGATGRSTVCDPRRFRGPR